MPVTGDDLRRCVRNVERALLRQPGVREVSVNLATERASVLPGPEGVARAELVSAVEKAGYGVIEVAEEAVAGGTAEREAREAAIQRQTRLVRIGVVFTAPLTVLSMARHLASAWPALAGAAPWLGWPGWPLVFWLPATVVLVVLGRQYFAGALRAARNGSANMDTLVALGSAAAYGYSVAALTGAFAGDGRVLRDGRRHSDAHHAGEVAGGAGARAQQRGHPAANAAGAADCRACCAMVWNARCPSASCRLGTSCWYGPAGASRWTAWCARARRRWTSPC